MEQWSEKDNENSGNLQQSSLWYLTLNQVKSSIFLKNFLIWETIHTAHTFTYVQYIVIAYCSGQEKKVLVTPDKYIFPNLFGRPCRVQKGS